MGLSRRLKRGDVVQVTELPSRPKIRRTKRGTWNVIGQAGRKTNVKVHRP